MLGELFLVTHFPQFQRKRIEMELTLDMNRKLSVKTNTFMLLRKDLFKEIIKDFNLKHTALTSFTLLFPLI